MKIIAILLNCCFLLLGITSTAQPVITAANKFKPGDWRRIQEAQITGVVAGSSGINQVWNYNNLVDMPGSSGFDSISLPSGGPIPPYFVGANLKGYLYYEYGGIVDEGDYFYKVSGDTVRNMGYWANPLDSFIQYYQNPYIVFPYYPFTYNSHASDSTLVTDVLGTGYTDTSRRNFDYKVTGYGTLILPGNRTFTDVLQVKTTTISSPFFFPEINMIYVKQGIPYPLLEMSISPLNGTVVGVDYMTSYGTGPVGPSYTFTGNGNWNNPANWQGGTMPPTTFTPGSIIIISHAPGGSCIINVPVTIPPGVQFIISSGANLVLPGNLTIQ